MMAAVMKLAAAGLICGALLNLTGGAQKELMRFGCACLMVIVLLSVLRQAKLPLLDTGWYEQQVRQQVEEAQEELRQAQLAQTAGDLAKALERQATTLGLECRIAVECTCDVAGQVDVSHVTVHYYSGPREALDRLRHSFCTQLAIPLERIMIQEVMEP